MPISSASPVTVDGNEYPYLAISLAISPVYGEAAVSGRLAMTAVPYRIEDGACHYAPDSAKRVSIGDIYEQAATDPAFATFLQTLMSAGQVYITAKGI
jgi:hypothetical protein